MYELLLINWSRVVFLLQLTVTWVLFYFVWVCIVCVCVGGWVGGWVVGVTCCQSKFNSLPWLVGTNYLVCDDLWVGGWVVGVTCCSYLTSHCLILLKIFNLIMATYSFPHGQRGVLNAEFPSYQGCSHERCQSKFNSLPWLVGTNYLVCDDL